MKLTNNSKWEIEMYIHNGWPMTKENCIGLINYVGAGSSKSAAFDPGDYCVYVNTGPMNPNPPGAGAQIASSGGVASNATVTITETLRIEII